jgi:phenylalanyl-tRNA synthetase alpha subunit
LNEYKRHIEQLELDKEQSRREELIRVEAKNAAPPSVTLNNEERDKFEQDINQLKQQLSDESEQYKKKFDDIQVAFHFGTYL